MVLKYGVSKKNHIKIEAVQVKFCKYVSGVSSQTLNVAVLGECGRFTLLTVYYTKCIKYRLKLVSLEASELMKSCYNMSLQMCDAGKINWIDSLSKTCCIIIWFQFCISKSGWR